MRAASFKRWLGCATWFRSYALCSSGYDPVRIAPAINPAVEIGYEIKHTEYARSVIILYLITVKYWVPHFFIGDLRILPKIRR